MTTRQSQEEVEAWLLLANLQLTPRLLTALLKRFQFSPQLALAASDAEREDIPGWLSRHTMRLHDPANRVTEKQRQWLQEHPLRILLVSDSDYPPLLREIHDPPPFLFVYGSYTALDHLAVGIVGSRRGTPYGKGVAEKMAKELTERGVTIVSGGASGIDTSAHRGALAGGGRTVAVLGCGVDVCYPKENAALFKQIAANGALLSEFALGSEPEFWRFPQRNRIVSGMSLGLLIVEAPKSSGALITARLAGEHGRTLMVIPGNIDRPMSVGSNELLREGAVPILSTEDILYALQLVPVPSQKAQQFQLGLEEAPTVPAALPPPYLNDLSPQTAQILQRLSNTPKHLDNLAQECGLDSSQMGVELTLMELSGLVSRLPGNSWIRVP
ncbi:MAG: DNA-processing protein DprA [Armatimonadetes bacterium]|nr:DNA-processing protein DprA [Armatimonadota bacterium]